ncbi:MAG: type I-B CRISPR-associated endonuclease Cas1b [Thermoplasmata archaeon]|jgi:CRISPR-associated protein Cas1
MRPFYIFSGSLISKENDSLIIKKKDGEVNLPIEAVDSIFIFGNTTITSPVLNILAKKGIPVILFSFNGNYLTSIFPENYLESGFVLVKQVECYLNLERRMQLARKFVEGAALNMNKVLKRFGAETIDIPTDKINSSKNVNELMGIEGKINDSYFSSIDTILPEDFQIGKRERRPPTNMGNSIISFGNTLVYSIITSEIFGTHLHPAISFLHEPGSRRSSLALDISEIFKPLFSHTIAISLIKRKILKETDFLDNDGVFLNDSGKKKFVSEFDSKIMETYYVNSLKRKVTYKRIIRLELYKIEKFIVENSPYKPFSPRRW